ERCTLGKYGASRRNRGQPCTLTRSHEVSRMGTLPLIRYAGADGRSSDIWIVLDGRFPYFRHVMEISCVLVPIPHRTMFCLIGEIFAQCWATTMG
ncbi:MAG: hypothetical protein KGO02_11360, partial [Alphaproteobacteria bacterium]|nr:hypothetical protein [Alphaproteobacteria bacterium]